MKVSIIFEVANVRNLFFENTFFHSVEGAKKFILERASEVGESIADPEVFDLQLQELPYSTGQQFVTFGDVNDATSFEDSLVLSILKITVRE